MSDRCMGESLSTSLGVGRGHGTPNPAWTVCVGLRSNRSAPAQWATALTAVHIDPRDSDAKVGQLLTQLQRYK